MVLLLLAYLSVQPVAADTIGITSTNGMNSTSSANPSGWIFFLKIVASSSVSISSISFYSSAPSMGNGNAGIYSDSGGMPGSLLAQGTPQALVNGWNSILVSASITASTNYWLGVEMQSGQWYYSYAASGAGGRAWISGGNTCCTLPFSAGSLSGSDYGSYAIYATYSLGPSTYNFNVHSGATQVVVTVSWTGPPGTASVTIAGPGGTPTLSESGAVVYDRVSYITGSSTPTNIHRVTFTLSSPPTGTWTAGVSQAGATVTIEVS